MTTGMTEYWGPRCEGYEPSCPCCEAWRLFDATGREPTDDDVDLACTRARLLRRPNYIHTISGRHGEISQIWIARRDLAATIRLWRSIDLKPRLEGRNHFVLVDEHGYRSDFMPC